MTCAAEIRRVYGSWAEAWAYVESRGFTCCPDGSWVNGRWAASIRQTPDGVSVVVWLRIERAA
jgi:hypothetical protein